MRFDTPKVHDEAEITTALASGQEVWYLDTNGTDGDDYYIGTRAEVIMEIEVVFVCEGLPDGWRLTPATAESWKELTATG
jgi:hypothetical protein